MDRGRGHMGGWAPTRLAKRMAGLAGGAGSLLAVLAAQPAQASEGGTNLYLLGSGGPEAAVLPPIQGVFLVNTLYRYDGEAGGGRQFVVGGNLVAGLEATVTADFATALWVPTTNFAGGGILALGAILPFGEPDVSVSATFTGPRGSQATRSMSDSAFVVGDPVVTGAVSWKHGDVTTAVSTLINIPIGDYREDQLANLAFHRWAADVSVAATWKPDKSGWDVSGKAGFTFNGENEHTDYDTGTEFHLEGSVAKTFNPSFSAGLQAYYYNQVTGDSGAGAVLGSFKGEVTGVGAQAAYNFKIMDKIPATLRLHAMTEFNATNRLEGSSVWLDFSMPLHVKMPPGH